MSSNFFREWRIKLLPFLAAYIAVKHLLMASWRPRAFGFRLFFLGSIILIVAWWLMDRADLLHLERQEELSAEDPKHLFDNSTGLSTNPRERAAIMIGMASMGMGLLIQAIAIGSIGMIFWGAALGMFAAAMWALT